MEKLEYLMNSTQFGNGKATDNSYTTAWVARIHNEDKTEPEFPECLDYIRRNQLIDGSWGAIKPFFIFDRIVSTLSAVICLKQWNYIDDQDIIAQGVKFIKNNLIHIGNLNEIKSQLSAGFELLLPALIDESNQMGLYFGSDGVIDEYRKEKERKVKMIKYCEQSNRDMPGFGSWYFSLEGLGSLYTNEQIEGMIDSNGLICGCYSATAFALIRGIESKASLEQIREIVNNNQGAVPTVCPMRVFDLAWSINYLYFSGYPISNTKLDTHLESLSSIWNEKKGLVGGTTSGLPPDADDISNTLLVLKLTDRLTEEEPTKSLMRFFRGGYFISYEAEIQPSLTTNINCLIALSHLNMDAPLVNTRNIICEWTKNYIIENNYSFEDKWHLSKYYGMSRSLIAFLYNDLEFGKTILEKIKSEQNNDGGWGMDGSTPIESAYVIIAISHWVRNSNADSCDEGRVCLERAKNYMRVANNEDIPSFWIDKTLYSLINLDKLAILCAKYCLKI